MKTSQRRTLKTACTYGISRSAAWAFLASAFFSMTACGGGSDSEAERVATQQANLDEPNANLGTANIGVGGSGNSVGSNSGASTRSARVVFDWNTRVPAQITTAPNEQQRARSIVEGFRRGLTLPTLQGVVSAESLSDRGPMTHEHSLLRPVAQLQLQSLRDGRLVVENTQELQELASPNAVSRPLRIAVPPIASGFTRVTDSNSSVSIEFQLKNASGNALSISDNQIVYADALGMGQHILQTVRGDALEDFVYFSTAPANEELIYEIDVRNVDGVRLVPDTNVIEFLDSAGVPRLHMKPPFLVDAAKRVVSIQVGLSGCQFDQSPRDPVGRSVTNPASDKCIARLRWQVQDNAYPLVVDPAWSSSGSMPGGPRAGQVAVVLDNGRVLVAGGHNIDWFANTTAAARPCSLFDPTSRTWSVTGSLTLARSIGGGFALPGNRAFVFGGLVNFLFGEGARSSTEVYDYAAGTWRFSDGTAGAPPRTNFARARPRHVRLPDGRFLIDGGRGGQAQSGNTDAQGTINTGCGYDPCCSHSADDTKTCPGYRSEIYDPVANTITLVPASHVHARDNHNLLLDPNNLRLLAFGINDTSTSYKLEQFLISTMSWSLLPPSAEIPTSVFGCTANCPHSQIEQAPALFLSNGKMFVIETGKNPGLGGDVGNDTGLFNPATQTWQSGPPQPGNDLWGSPAASTRGNIFPITGGRYLLVNHRKGQSAYAYTPHPTGAGSIAVYGSGTVYNHDYGAFAQLQDGRVMLIGGWIEGTTSPHSNTEILSECTANADCGGTTPFCAACNECVQCVTNAHCAINPTNKICDTTSNECVQCVSNMDCPAATPYCERTLVGSIRIRTCQAAQSTISTNVCSNCSPMCRRMSDTPSTGLGRDPNTRMSSTMISDNAAGRGGITLGCIQNTCM